MGSDAHAVPSNGQVVQSRGEGKGTQENAVQDARVGHGAGGLKALCDLHRQLEVTPKPKSLWLTQCSHTNLEDITNEQDCAFLLCFSLRGPTTQLPHKYTEVYSL